jgi:hypothetical protein
MSYFQRFLYTIGYFIAMTTIVVLFLILNGNINSLINFQFPYFDSEHYEAIKNGNYNDWRSAFFPGFPLLWKLTLLGNVGISVFNLVLFALSYSLLSFRLNFNLYNHFIGLMLPSIVFFALPYSESFFFASSVLIIVGLKYNHVSTFLIGILIASFVRPVIMILIPALAFLLLFEYGVYKRFNKTIFFGLITAFVSLTGVFIVQYLINGEALGFFQSQSNGWGNNLRFPSLPLSSWSGNFITMLDAVALWIGLCFGILALFNVAIYFKGSAKEEAVSSENLLSLLFVSGTAVVVLFTRGGLLFSLNRFVFLTPFFVLALHYVISMKMTLKQCLFIAFSFVIFSLAMGSYVHIQLFLKYLILGGLIFTFLFLLSDKEPKNKLVKWLPLIIVFVFQVCMIFRVLSHEWIA